MFRRWRTRPIALIVIFVTTVPGCSIKKVAINKLGDALAGSGTTFASDDDPELIESAVPFSLKLIESLLAESPNHRGMLIAASSGFTQYAYAFIQQQADEAEDKDLARATALRGRARRMYLRARGYGLRALEVKHRGFEAALRKDSKEAVRMATKADVPALYWTAACWVRSFRCPKISPTSSPTSPLSKR